MTEPTTTTRTLLIGGTGTGKTTQFGTFPGPRKFAYVFDPTGIAALSRWPEIEQSPFFPSVGDLDMGTYSVAKRVGGSYTQRRDHALSRNGPQLYLTWVKDFNDRAAAGFFDNIDSLLVDSLTLLSVAIMDRVRWHQRTIAAEDERMDYRIGGDVMTKVLQGLAGLPCNLLLTAHTQFAKDDATARSWYRITLPGGSRVFVPRLMDNIFLCQVVSQGEDKPARYMVQTRPNRDYPDIRTSVDGLGLHEDVTMNLKQPPAGQGLGKFLWR